MGQPRSYQTLVYWTPNKDKVCGRLSGRMPAPYKKPAQYGFHFLYFAVSARSPASQMSTSEQSAVPKAPPIQIILHFIDTATSATAKQLTERGESETYFNELTVAAPASIDDWHNAAKYARTQAWLALGELNRLQQRLQEIPEQFGSSLDLGPDVTQQDLGPLDYVERVRSASQVECMLEVMRWVQIRGEAGERVEKLRPELDARLNGAYEGGWFHGAP